MKELSIKNTDTGEEIVLGVDKKDLTLLTQEEINEIIIENNIMLKQILEEME